MKPGAREGEGEGDVGDRLVRVRAQEGLKVRFRVRV